MSKRLSIAVPFVVGLLSVVLIVGSVLAQSTDTPSSAEFTAIRPLNPASTESAPTVGYQTGSTGQPPASSADTSAKAAGAPVIEREPGPATSAGQDPNAPHYNSSIRFVGSTLRPRDSSVNYTTNGNGSCAYVTGGNASIVWNLPLALPEGSKVEFLRMYYYDASTTQNTSGWFTKYDLYGGLVEEWAVNSTGSGGNGYTDVQITPTETINYSAYSYVLNWRPGTVTNTLQLCGFRLYYTAPVGGVYLPIIVRQ